MNKALRTNLELLKVYSLVSWRDKILLISMDLLYLDINKWRFANGYLQKMCVFTDIVLIMWVVR